MRNKYFLNFRGTLKNVNFINIITLGLMTIEWGIVGAGNNANKVMAFTIGTGAQETKEGSYEFCEKAEVFGFPFGRVSFTRT